MNTTERNFISTDNLIHDLLQARLDGAHHTVDSLTGVYIRAATAMVSINPVDDMDRYLSATEDLHRASESLSRAKSALSKIRKSLMEVDLRRIDSKKS